MLRSADLLALSKRVTLSQGSNLGISPPVTCQLPSVLALTRVGLAPTSRYRLNWARNKENSPIGEPLGEDRDEVSRNENQ
jgi:hypothetical protein